MPTKLPSGSHGPPEGGGPGGGGPAAGTHPSPPGESSCESGYRSAKGGIIGNVIDDIGDSMPGIPQGVCMGDTGDIELGVQGASVDACDMDEGASGEQLGEPLSTGRGEGAPVARTTGD